MLSKTGDGRRAKTKSKQLFVPVLLRKCSSSLSPAKSLENGLDHPLADWKQLNNRNNLLHLCVCVGDGDFLQVGNRA